MPSAALCYKEPFPSHAEAVDLDGQLWDHIRTATSFVERMNPEVQADQGPSAVVVRSASGEAVVVALFGHRAGMLPTAADLCHRYNLTPREADVALLLAERLSCREIAARLFLSFYTVRSHTERIMDKLGVRSKHAIRPLFVSGKPALPLAAPRQRKGLVAK